MGKCRTEKGRSKTFGIRFCPKFLGPKFFGFNLLDQDTGHKCMDYLINYPLLSSPVS